MSWAHMPCCRVLQTVDMTVTQPRTQRVCAMQEAQQQSGGGRSGPVQFALEVSHDFLALLSRLQQQPTAYTQHASSSKGLHAKTDTHIMTS